MGCFVIEWREELRDLSVLAKNTELGGKSNDRLGSNRRRVNPVNQSKPHPISQMLTNFKFHSTESETALTPFSSRGQKDVESPWKIEFIILIVLGITFLVLSAIVLMRIKIIQDKGDDQSK